MQEKLTIYGNVRSSLFYVTKEGVEKECNSCRVQSKLTLMKSMS